MSDDERPRAHERWAHLRFSVVGSLLASPPALGELRTELERLAQRRWRHPTTGADVCFGASTIERWYYAAKAGANPVGALRRKVREDRGRSITITDKLSPVVRRQYEEHSTWSYQLHLDNLVARIEADSDLGVAPSYPTLRRFMLAQGLVRKPSRQVRRRLEREIRAREDREVRSFENEYVNGLWHLDFHHGSLKVLTPHGEWVAPLMLGILDDHSRLTCHAQWYLAAGESAEDLIHGLEQAFMKRGMPRSLLSDNGSAMIATETRQGLARLSVIQNTTLPGSPYQNGKQESFWGQVEGRLLPMLEGQPDLTLAFLNQATQAWLEMEYNQKVHSETGQAPLARWLGGRNVGRDCPGIDELRLAFTARKTRTQRQSDGTVSIEGTRFEIPSRFRHLKKLDIRYASWNLTRVWLMDENTGVVLARLYPLDKAKNADGFRGMLKHTMPAPVTNASGLAPLLRKYMTEYAATGLPPAYIPKEEK